MHVHVRPLVVRRYKLLRDFVEGRCVGAVGVDCCVCALPLTRGWVVQWCQSPGDGCFLQVLPLCFCFYCVLASIHLPARQCAEDVKWADMHAVVALCLGFRADPATGAVTQQVCVTWLSLFILRGSLAYRHLTLFVFQG